ncbi:MAG: hypothetical protein V1676_05735 [Candidatus Diapherotrites archaeon]
MKKQIQNELGTGPLGVKVHVTTKESLGKVIKDLPSNSIGNMEIINSRNPNKKTKRTIYLLKKNMPEYVIAHETGHAAYSKKRGEILKMQYGPRDYKRHLRLSNIDDIASATVADSYAIEALLLKEARLHNRYYEYLNIQNDKPVLEVIEKFSKEKGVAPIPNKDAARHIIGRMLAFAIFDAAPKSKTKRATIRRIVAENPNVVASALPSKAKYADVVRIFKKMLEMEQGKTELAANSAGEK